MENDKYLNLLNKLAKLLRAKEILESKSDITDFEKAVLQRIDVGAEICIDTLDAMDELWQVYEEESEQRPEIQALKEDKAEPVKKSTEDDALGLGVGMALGGIFDYLKSPDNVEKVDKSEQREIQNITDEELEALEQNFTESFSPVEASDDHENIQFESNELEFPTTSTQEVAEEYSQLEEIEDLSIARERQNLDNALADLTDLEQNQLVDNLEQLGIRDEFEEYEEALGAVTDFEGVF